MRCLAIVCSLALIAVGCESTTKTGEPDRSATVPMTLVLLRAGGSLDISAEERTQLIRGHFANMTRMAEDGYLLLAGPFDKSRRTPDPSLSGLFVFDTADPAQAEAWVQSDPSVAAGVFSADYLSMSGPESLRELNALHVEMVEGLPAEERGHPGAGIRPYVVAFANAPGVRFRDDLIDSGVLVRAELADGREVAIFDRLELDEVAQRLGDRFTCHPWAGTAALRDLAPAGKSG